MRPSDLQRLVSSSRWKDTVLRAFAEHGEAPPTDALHIGYVRYKPDAGCLLGIQTLDDDGDVPVGYVKLFDREDPETCYRKYAGWESDGGWVALAPDLNAVLFRFPLDRAVRSLRFLVDRNRLKHVLHESAEGFSPSGQRIRGSKSRLHLLKYKPERRCIVRADLVTKDERTGARSERRIVAQANGDDSGARVHAVTAHLHRAAAELRDLSIARPLGYDAERRILCTEWVEGDALGGVLHEGRAAPGCEAAGRALRELHALPVPALAAAKGDPTDRARRILEDLDRITDGDLEDVSDGLRRRLESRLEAAGARPHALVHGDFYFHQVILEGDGCRLIDWDETGVGDPRTDVGNFLAHLHLREIQGRLAPDDATALRHAFRQGYESTLDDATLDTFTAVQLVLLSLVPFRNLRAGWREECRAILRRSGELLNARREVHS